jgi:hypothetical protein
MTLRATARRHGTASHPICSARPAVRAAIVQDFSNVEPASYEKTRAPQTGEASSGCGHPDLLRRVESAPKPNGQNVSEWIRSTLAPKRTEPIM